MQNETIAHDLERAADRPDDDAKRRTPAPERRLPPAVALLESSAAACVLGRMHRHRGDDGGAGLVLGVALQVFALFADDSPFAPHADALATGILAACAYRCSLGDPGVGGPPGGMPPPPSPSGRAPRRLDLAVARLTVSEGV
jgi:hypothetical protein